MRAEPVTSDRPTWAMYTCGRFGAVLSAYRRRTKLSQNQLGIRCGINPSYVNRMESGERNRPTIEVTQAFIAALRLDTRDADELLLAAGYAPSFGDDRTIRQLAVLLIDAPEETAAMLRAMVSAAYRVVAGGGKA